MLSGQFASGIGEVLAANDRFSLLALLLHACNKFLHGSIGGNVAKIHKPEICHENCFSSRFRYVVAAVVRLKQRFNRGTRKSLPTQLAVIVVAFAREPFSSGIMFI